MCGIVGCILNDRNTVDVAMSMLCRVEYRGYDSAGVATLSENGIILQKKAGAIAKLNEVLNKNILGNVSIAHTRWATHGKATDNNAHPFVSNSGQWALVHNGIIENYLELKTKCLPEKCILNSETDTEIVVQMLDYAKGKNCIEKLKNVCDKLKGSYAFACVNVNAPNTIFLAKNKSPLYIMNATDGCFIASDPICFAGKTGKIYSLEDYEYAVVSDTDIIFFDNNMHVIVKNDLNIKIVSNDKGLNNCPHYMLKEIEEEGKVLDNILRTYTEGNVLRQFDSSMLSRFNEIVFIGCGTAYHAGLYGADIFRMNNHIRTSCYMASEYRYCNPIVDDKTLVVLVSQSGETADTIAVCDMVRAMGATTIALTNVLYSTLAKKVDYILPVCAGSEIAVASTKAYIAQLSVLYIWSMSLLGDAELKNALANIANLAKNFDNYKYNELKSIAKKVSKIDCCYFLGRGMDYITALEGSLKLKEVTYINCQAYPAGELKHGHLALIDDTSYLVAIATDDSTLDKTLNGAYEAKARGGKIIVLTNKEIKTKEFYRVIKLCDYNKYLMPIVVSKWIQMLAYVVSITKGYNPDKPRNLAKSVTVE